MKKKNKQKKGENTLKAVELALAVTTFRQVQQQKKINNYKNDVCVNSYTGDR